MEADRALAKVGGFRRFHVAAFCVLNLSAWLAYAGQNLVFYFIGNLYRPFFLRKICNTATESLAILANTTEKMYVLTNIPES